MKKIYVAVEFEIEVPSGTPEYNKLIGEKNIDDCIKEYLTNLPENLKPLDYTWDYNSGVLSFE